MLPLPFPLPVPVVPPSSSPEPGVVAACVVTVIVEPASTCSPIDETSVTVA